MSTSEGHASSRQMRWRAWNALAELQTRSPFIPLGIVSLITAIAIVFSLRLKMLTGFESLLPDSRASVLELNRVAARTAGISTLFVVLEGGPDTPIESLRKTADALVPALDQIGPPWIGSVESGVHETIRYLSPRAGLFADKNKLSKLRDDVVERYEYEVAKEAGTLIDDSDPPAEINASHLKNEFGITETDQNRYPGGYYQSQDGKTIVVAIRSKIMSTDFTLGTEAIRRVHDVVAQVNPSSFHSQIHYAFAGDLQTAVSEYASFQKDLTEVGLTGAILIGGIVLLYYLRLRTLIAMLLTIGVGVSWTFGITQMLIGHLNMATGFLFSIIAGNGINFSIIYMARYMEARRRQHSLSEAILIAHRETWIPTLTAGCAASVAYGSLMVTEFRGFRDFGLIGSIGMVLCWIATYVTLPAILVVIDNIVPLNHDKPGFFASLRSKTEGGVAFGKPFAAIVPKAPGSITILGVLLSIAGLFGTYRYIISDPMEYDLRRLRNDESARQEEIRLTKLAEKITGYVGADGMAILVDHPEQVEPLRKALYARRDAATMDQKPFKEIHALQDFVPQDQSIKIPLLLEIKDKVLRARKRKAISDDDFAKIEPFLPPNDLKPFTMNDLPSSLARTFTEADGTRGRVVYISPISEEAVHDAHYLLRWADSYRHTELPDKSVVLGSGRAVIYADMWAAILSDVPKAISFSFVATLLVVLAAFRRNRATLAVLGTLIVGVAWMVGLLVIMKVRLNFLNFVALPITFGIGVDYAVNIVQRYLREGTGGALIAVKETGGAVILCSLTTIFGYLALVRSMNYAVRSMGIAAVLGEISCLLAAVLVLPAVLVWLDRRKNNKVPA